MDQWSRLLLHKWPLPIDGPTGRLIVDVDIPIKKYLRLLSALKSISDRPWWRRVWVRQEYLLTKRLNFACGHERISDSAFAAGRAFLEYTAGGLASGLAIGGWKVIRDVAVYGESWATTRMVGVLLDYRHEFDPGNPFALFDWLAQIRLWTNTLPDASNKSDVVYAMLGVSSPESWEGLKVDCGKPVHEVYTEAARVLIKTASP